MNDHVARTFGRNYVPNKLYADRDPLALGDHYTAHVAAMTREALHDKAAIAAELAYRDREIALGKVAYRMAEQRAIDAENKLDAATKQRDAFAALMRRFVSFAIEMPADMGTCLAMGNKIVDDARALLKELPK